MPRRGIQGALLTFFFSFALIVSALLVSRKNSYILQGHRLAPKPRFYAESRSVTETKAITSPSLGPCGRTHFTAANCHLRDPSLSRPVKAGGIWMNQYLSNVHKFFSSPSNSQIWWYRSIIPAYGRHRLRWKDSDLRPA